MTRAVLVLNAASVRERAIAWCRKAPPGTRVEFKDVKRSLPQNDRMWAMLTDIARQKEHMGRRYTVDQWKEIFLDALGRETTFAPSLDGSTFIPLGRHSSDLSKGEMSDMIELLFSWGAENGVEWSEPKQEAAA